MDSRWSTSYLFDALTETKHVWLSNDNLYKKQIYVSVKWTAAFLSMINIREIKVNNALLQLSYAYGQHGDDLYSKYIHMYSYIHVKNVV